MDNDDVTEITEMQSSRVDAVKGAANGATFLLVKALAEDPDLQADLAKAEQSTAEQNDLPDSDFAYIEPGGTKDDDGKTTPRSLRHFPIGDAAHTRNALSRAPQSPFGDKAMPKIRAAAKRFGIDVAKATTVGVDSTTGLYGSPLETGATVITGHTAADEPIAVIPEADQDAENADLTVAKGDASVPGSPEWEQADANVLHGAATALAAVSAQLEAACDREEAEVMAGDTDDLSDVYDLGDAMCCLQQALSIVARLAYTEAAEGTDPSGVAKAGRRLSSKSEQALQDTIAALTALLAGDTSSIPSTATAKGATGTDEEDTVNEEQLAKALKDNNAELATAITAGIGEVIKGLVPAVTPEPVAKAADASTTTATAPATVPATPDPTEALVKGLADAFKEAVHPLEERMAKMEATPRRGVGPLAMVPRGPVQGGDVAAMIKGLLDEANTAPTREDAAAKRQQASLLSLSTGYATGKVYDTLA